MGLPTVYIPVPFFASSNFLNPVSTVSALPTSASLGAVITTQDTGTIYTWNGTSWVTQTAPTMITARYFGSTTTLSGSLATVVWTTKDYDANSAMASGVYTFPSSGQFQINVALQITGTIALNSLIDLQIQRNSVSVGEIQNYAGGLLTSQNAQYSDILSFSQNDTLRIQTSSSAIGPAIVTGSTRVFISIGQVA